ncbi:MAG: glycoside hydrolase family 36 protein [Candidatus Caccosoma sp.]|nr:glycoside hydrolase family 36 protein [Candidatus Caccosoma sp.]
MENKIINDFFNIENADFVDDIKISQKTINNVTYYKLHFTFNNKDIHEMKISFKKMVKDVSFTYKPSFLANTNYRPNWDYGNSIESKFSHCSPIFGLLNAKNEMIYSVSLSDCAHIIRMHIGVIEETLESICIIRLFDSFTTLDNGYELEIRVDENIKPLSDALKEINDYLYKVNNIKMNITSSAYNLVYSTWYNFHQNLKQDELLEEMKLASNYGVKTLIIDDGWQTDDSSRGYSFCGDWEIAKSRFYNFKKFVEDVHKLNIKVMLWIGLPFIGKNSKHYEKLKGKYLNNDENSDTFIIDPRYKKCRDYVVSTLTRLLTSYDLDGFKIDFIDSFNLSDKNTYNKEMDYKSLETALDKLFISINNLKEIKNDLLIEFRQNYTSPVLDKSANMIRVADCPADYKTNYSEIINLRLTTKLAVSADMTIFASGDSISQKARHLYATMFGVPQFSFVLKNLSNDDKKLLKTFSQFYLKNQDILMANNFKALGNPISYDMAYSFKDNKRIIALYNTNYLCINDDDVKTTIVNLSSNDNIIIETNKKINVQIFDAFYRLVDSLTLTNKLNKINIPSFTIIEIN